MTNPLFRPDDPRFQKREVRNAEGKNPFAELEESDISLHHEVYAASGRGDRPFVPRFEAQEQSRAGLLLFLGGAGWGTALVGAASLTGLFGVGLIAPLLGVVPATIAWMLATKELRAIAVGAMDSSNSARAWHAYWLGLSGTIACAAIVAAMIYRRVNLLPDIR